jgi:hypothetical protein
MEQEPRDTQTQIVLDVLAETIFESQVVPINQADSRIMAERIIGTMMAAMIFGIISKPITDEM